MEVPAPSFSQNVLTWEWNTKLAGRGEVNATHAVASKAWQVLWLHVQRSFAVAKSLAPELSTKRTKRGDPTNAPTALAAKRPLAMLHLAQRTQAAKSEELME